MDNLPQLCDDLSQPEKQLTAAQSIRKLLCEKMFDNTTEDEMNGLCSQLMDLDIITRLEAILFASETSFDLDIETRLQSIYHSLEMVNIFAPRPFDWRLTQQDVYLCNNNKKVELESEIVWILINLSLNEVVAIVIACSCIPFHLSRLLSSSDREVRNQSAWCLTNIVSESVVMRDRLLDDFPEIPTKLMMNLTDPCLTEIERSTLIWSLEVFLDNITEPNARIIQRLCPLIESLLLRGGETAALLCNVMGNIMHTNVYSLVFQRISMKRVTCFVQSAADDFLLYPSRRQADRTRLVHLAMVMEKKCPEVLRFLPNFLIIGSYLMPSRPKVSEVTHAAIDLIGSMVYNTEEAADDLFVDMPVMQSFSILLQLLPPKQKITHSILWMLSNVAANSLEHACGLVDTDNVLTESLAHIYNDPDELWLNIFEAGWVVYNIMVATDSKLVQKLVFGYLSMNLVPEAILKRYGRNSWDFNMDVYNKKCVCKAIEIIILFNLPFYTHFHDVVRICSKLFQHNMHPQAFALIDLYSIHFPPSIVDQDDPVVVRRWVDDSASEKPAN